MIMKEPKYIADGIEYYKPLKKHVENINLLNKSDPENIVKRLITEYWTYGPSLTNACFKYLRILSESGMSENYVNELLAEFNTQKRFVKDKIQDFVKLHIDETIKFPHLFSVSDKNYVKALQQIIKNENIDINLESLEKLINKEFELQIISIFKKSFLEANACLMSCNGLLQNWINAYINTFGNNTNYVAEFVKMLEFEEVSINFDTDFEEDWELKKAMKNDWDFSSETHLHLVLSRNPNYSGDSKGLWEFYKCVKEDSLSYDDDSKKLIYIYKIITNTIEEKTTLKLADSLSLVMKKGEKLVSSDEITISDIDTMSGLDFEHFIGNLFSAMGYKVEITKASGDQGGDLIIEKFGERTIIQAKRYSGAVTNSAIQEVVAAKAHYNCIKSLVITNSYFTKSAMELANSNNVELWDREKLEEQLEEFNLNHFTTN